TRVGATPRMLLTRGCRPIGRGRAGLPVRSLVPLLESARDAVLAVAVPAVVAPATPAAHEGAHEPEEQEQAEDREQEPEREEPEAPPVRMPVVRDDRRATGRGDGRGDDDLLGALREPGFVRADGDRAAQDEDEDRGEKTSHG